MVISLLTLKKQGMTVCKGHWAGYAASYINLLPVWTLLLGVLLLQKQISIIMIFGGIISIFGAILASL